MSPSAPFVDRETGALDTDQIRQEAYPLVGLIALFVGLALIPFLLLFLGFGNTVIGIVLTLLMQFILAVGTAIVLIYIVARGIQLADE